MRLRSCESEEPGWIGTASIRASWRSCSIVLISPLWPSDRERLHPLEGGPGVGRVAVVAEAADRLEALVAQVGVVLAEHVRRAHHLVDAGGRREGGDVDVEAASRARSAARRGRGRGGRRRGRGRRSARSAAPPRARSGRGRASRRRRSARRGRGSRPRASSSRASCWILSRSWERSMKMWATAKASSRVSEGSWPPARTSSAQIFRGRSSSSPQPSPSPSTLPARWSIFCRAGIASSIGVVARRRVLADRGVDRAGVLVLDAGRRYQWLVGQLGRVALDARARPDWCFDM